jgi:hypothetical protein
MGAGRSHFFQARTIRWELGVPPETLKNKEEVRPALAGREAGLGHVFYRAYTDVSTACLRMDTQLLTNP